MAERGTPPYRELFGIGTLLLILTLFPGWAPAGPWGEESFTRGLFGLIAGSMIYVAWYRFTFNTNGLVPALSMWRNPTKSIPNLAVAGVVFFIGSGLIGHYVDFIPIPFTLIMALVGLLMMLLAGYAWLVIDGPLQDSEEE